MYINPASSIVRMPVLLEIVVHTSMFVGALLLLWQKKIRRDFFKNIQPREYPKLHASSRLKNLLKKKQIQESR